ncbi:MAG: helix-turn-helix transcriptional regulator [Humidesulfovibrio sp.]|nr:helix-turn-helix transcriptional regulator [Humidesulfovibrio sp.]
MELTRKPRTDGMVEIMAVVPQERGDAVARAIAEAAEPNIPADLVFPQSTPGTVLRGARGLRGMTQATLAAAIGVHVPNISEMERGARPIGKEMAKRLGKALDMPWKSFL